MAQLRLYDFRYSPFARKVRVAMAEKGIRCETVAVDLMSGAQRNPEYLALNPHGRVPTLVVDGRPIYESSAIIEYLGGDAVSTADIAAVCGVEFQQMMGIAIDPRNEKLLAWRERMNAQPSVQASMA